MRIIRGRYKGRQIITPKNLNVRPTTDFAKEAMMNIIENNLDLDECEILDLFSGTGNISFELASRGGKRIRAVEQNIACYKFISKTKQNLDFDNLSVTRADVFRFLTKINEQYDLIFADPFYDMPKVEKIPELIFEKNLLKDGGWLVLEHSKKHDFSGLKYFDSQRTYGNANFTIFIKQ